MSEPANTADLTLAVVAGVFDARPGAEAELGAVLAHYVVVSRTSPGCRNIDLCGSVTAPGRYLVIEKWDSPASQRAHFDSPDMVEMARACNGLLTKPPQIDLLEAISAHDLN